MIPILYDSTETAFINEGIGRLSDAISCTVTEERNGSYELEMEYPITGIHYSDIELMRIISAVPADGKDRQPFDIYKISKPINGKVTVNARHVSYRLSGIVTKPASASTCSGALQVLKNNAVIDCPFSFSTDKTTSADFSYTEPVSIRSRLGGSDGSVLDVYGGEYEWDKWSVKLWNARGSDNGVTIRYGFNLTDLKQEESIDSTVTGILPYWKSDKTVVIGSVVYSENASKWAHQIIEAHDFSQDFDSQPSTSELNTQAQTYITENGIGTPSISIDVSFVALWQTEEYKNVASLQHVNLCDTVTIIFDRLGVRTTAKVIKTEYNVLTDKYDSISLGDAKQTLAKTIAESNGAKNILNDIDSIKSTVTTVQNDVNAVQGSAAYLEFGSSGTSTTLSTTATTVQNTNITETDTYNAAAGSLTIKNAGRYMIVANATFQGTGNVHFSMLSGGSAVQTTSTYISGVGTVSASAIVTASDGTVMTFTESCDSGQTIASTGAEKISFQKLA